MNEPVEAIVVGGGPGGLSAALWLGRHRRRTLLFDSGEYRNWSVTESYGYFAHDASDPAALRQRARKDLERYQTVDICKESVHGARTTGSGFEVATAQGSLRCRSLILATGVRDELPRLDGLAEHYGTSVFHCPSCDGYEARGKAVVVLGCDESAIGVARQLSECASQVTIVRSDHQDALPNPGAGLRVRPTPARRLIADAGELTGVELSDGEVVPAQFVFFSTEPIPANVLAGGLGCSLDEKGCVRVDENGMTDVRGVFAAGDLVPGAKLIQVAAASGAIAGVGCAAFLSQ